ncbi:unnamed protein product [Lampetra fluviatilis]
MIESPCPDTDDHYCFHGVCFIMENRRCSPGFEGHRCHFMSLRQRQDEPAAPLVPVEPLLVLALMLMLVAAASLAAWAWCCYRFKRRRFTQQMSQAPGDLPGSGKQRLVALGPA